LPCAQERRGKPHDRRHLRGLAHPDKRRQCWTSLRRCVRCSRRSTVSSPSVAFKAAKTVFADYRLRIAGVIRDYGLTGRREEPLDSLLRFR
jgi:hypothetical protein